MKEKHKTTFGTTSMILGIMGLILFLAPYIALFLSILSVVFYGIQKKKDNESNEQTNGMTTTGLVLGIIGIVVNAIMLIFMAVLLAVFAGV